MSASRNANIAYAVMAAINFAVGYHYIHVLPVQLVSDVGQNIDVANALLGRGGEFYYYRAWGYPLFLILTGYPWSLDPEPVRLVQLALGSAIPYLIGSTLGWVGVRSSICIVAAGVVLLSFSPILLTHVLLTDQVSEFLLYLCMWLVSLALMKPKTRRLRLGLA